MKCAFRDIGGLRRPDEAPGMGILGEVERTFEAGADAEVKNLKPDCSDNMPDGGGRDRERLAGRQSIGTRERDRLIALQSMGTSLWSQDDLARHRTEGERNSSLSVFNTVLVCTIKSNHLHARLPFPN